MFRWALLDRLLRPLLKDASGSTSDLLHRLGIESGDLARAACGRWPAVQVALRHGIAVDWAAISRAYATLDQTWTSAGPFGPILVFVWTSA